MVPLKKISTRNYTVRISCSKCFSRFVIESSANEIVETGDTREGFASTSTLNNYCPWLMLLSPVGLVLWKLDHDESIAWVHFCLIQTVRCYEYVRNNSRSRKVASRRLKLTISNNVPMLVERTQVTLWWINADNAQRENRTGTRETETRKSIQLHSYRSIGLDPMIKEANTWKSIKRSQAVVEAHTQWRAQVKNGLFEQMQSVWYLAFPVS